MLIKSFVETGERVSEPLTESDGDILDCTDCCCIVHIYVHMYKETLAFAVVAVYVVSLTP